MVELYLHFFIYFFVVVFYKANQNETRFNSLFCFLLLFIFFAQASSHLIMYSVTSNIHLVSEMFLFLCENNPNDVVAKAFVQLSC